ncbi:MAG: FxsA family protein [Rhodocyclaceae bacterium]|nr:FxsA family protein [Rhodocyclaceae bacterium]
MRLVILAILMGFPLLEGALLFKLASGEHGSGVWVLAWLVFAAIAGIVLIKQARFSLVSRLALALSQGQFSISALVDSFRTVIAGLLLIFPGFISDVMALAILLIPIREPAFVRAGPSRPHSSAASGRPFTPADRNHRVIEGEFRRD